MSFLTAIPSRTRRVLIIIALSCVLALLVWLAIRERPPSSIRLATGPEGEHEYLIALIYEEYMEERGIDVEIVPTAGSLETMELLQAGAVDAGFMLNGANIQVDESDQVSVSELSNGLVALAGVTHVPIWVFYRSELETDGPLDEFADLQGLRVSLDEPQSGTRALSLFLLNASDVPLDEIEIVDADPLTSAEMLSNGEIDAMFLVSGVLSQNVQELMLAPGIEILNLRLAESYARMIRFLRKVDVLEGSLSIADNNPPEVKNLLSDASVLIARDDLHPDMQLLLLRAATDAQDKTFDIFPSDEVFPTVEGLSLSVSAVTKRFIDQGQTFLQRYLPFWIASPLERFYLLVVPAVLLILPLLRSGPGAYAYMMRGRVNVWYKQIRQIEIELDQYTIAELDGHIAELHELEQELTKTISISSGYLQAFYNLRQHIRLVIERLRDRKTQLEQQGLDRDAHPQSRG